MKAEELRSRTATWYVAALAALVLLATPVAGQGGTLQGDDFTVRYPEGLRGLATRFLTAWFPAESRIRELTGLEVPPGARVVLVRDVDRLREVAAAEGAGPVPDWVAGVALPLRGLVIVRTDLVGPRAERVDGLLVHEMTHLALGALRDDAGRRLVPLWFEEGLAQVAEGRLLVGSEAQLARDALFGRLHAFADLDAGFPRGGDGAARAYAQSEGFVRYIMRGASRGRPPHRLASPRAILEGLGAGRSIEEVLRRETGRDLEELETAWRKRLRSHRGAWLEIFGEVALGAALLLLVLFGSSRIVRRRQAALERLETSEDPELPAEAAGAEEAEAVPGDDPEPPDLEADARPWRPGRR